MNPFSCNSPIAFFAAESTIKSNSGKISSARVVAESVRAREDSSHHLEATLTGGNRAVPLVERPGLLEMPHTQWRWTMATEPEKWSGLATPRSNPTRRGRVTPERHKDLLLCVAFVVLLLWALGVGLGVLK